MKKLKKIKKNKILAATLILALMMVIVISSPLTADECENALVYCFIDAVLVGVFGGAEAWLYYSYACALGFDWCMRYYQM